MLENIV